MSGKTYRLKKKDWANSNSGLYVIEDFVPVSDSTALITSGPAYRSLESVCLVRYEICDQKSELVLSAPVIVASGAYLRLGRLADDARVQYSDGFTGPHQPYEHFYSDGAPRCKIYRKGELFVDHWDDYVEVGNPWYDRPWLYFEARREHRKAPQGWELWRLNLLDGRSEYLFDGANPCIYKNQIFYCTWNVGRFDIGIAPVPN